MDAARAFPRAIARRLRLREPATRGQRGGGDFSLSPTPDAPVAGARHGVAFLPGGLVSGARRGVTGASGNRQATHRGRHESAPGARPHGDAAGRAPVAPVAAVSVARGRGVGGPATVHRGFAGVAGWPAASAGDVTRGARPGTRRRAAQPDERQRARNAGGGGVAGGGAWIEANFADARRGRRVVCLRVSKGRCSRCPNSSPGWNRRLRRSLRPA